MKGVGRSFLSVTINQQPSSISTPTDPVMATADSSQPLGSQSQKESPKTTSSQTQSSQISPSLRWLGTCGQLFRPAEKDTKDVLCMIEVLQDRVLRTDVVLAGTKILSTVGNSISFFSSSIYSKPSLILLNEMK